MSVNVIVTEWFTESATGCVCVCRQVCRCNTEGLRQELAVSLGQDGIKLGLRLCLHLHSVCTALSAWTRLLVRRGSG